METTEEDNIRNAHEKGRQEAMADEIKFLGYELEIEKTNDWIDELEYLRAVKSHVEKRIAKLKEKNQMEVEEMARSKGSEEFERLGDL